MLSENTVVIAVPFGYLYCLCNTTGFLTLVFGNSVPIYTESCPQQFNHQQYYCEQNRNLLKCLNVDNNAVRFFHHEFMHLRVYNVAILCV